ncbi:MAG TPA: glycoside hydrolase family 38 C-terminal domain-containing protein, partial [Phycisphaeraceae bacterium]
VTPEELLGTWKTYRPKLPGLAPLMTFGHGDGGGGPTSQMVESALRLADGPPSSQLPQVVLEPVRSLVRRVLDRAPQLPVWDGELYLEYHQGTYTSQGWLKRMNRQNETRLQQLEWLISLAAPLGYAHDKSRLDRWWEQLLLMHFHDVLPGSSVGEVYQDVRRMQQTLADELDQAIGEAAQFLTERIDTASAAQPLVLFNTLSWDRSDPIRLPDGTWRDDVTIPAGGWRVIDAADAPTAQPSIVVAENGRRLESRYWRIELDEQGRIVQLYDRVNDRSVLRPGGVGNAWQLFEDRPLDFDAWNIDYDYEQHRLPAPKLESIQTVERGPVRTAVELTWSLPQVDGEPQTRIRQRLALYEHHPRIDFETQIDWHEHHKLLKTAFEVNIRATQAAHEVQFGHLYRPTHRNTSWDRAKYETCAHRWVDLSEHGYGVALLNDCKYGHDIHDGVIRLTCIKSAQSPDASADQGHHQFTYSLLPHAGSLQEAGVIRAAAELNTPAVVHTAAPTPGRLPAHQAGPRCDSPAVMLSTVKPAESGRGLVLRLYEAHGSHTQAQVKLPQPPTSARYVNLLEEPMDEAGDLRVEGDTLTLSLSPFQIVSLHVTFS